MAIKRNSKGQFVKGSQKGYVPWNKGKKEIRISVLEKLSDKLKRAYKEKRRISFFQKGNKINLGRKHSETTKKKMSDIGKKRIGNKNPFYHKKHSERTKEILRKKMKGKFKKEKHWNWQGGLTSEEERIRYSLEYKIWKLEVYKRDKGKCGLCGKRCNNKNIVAHHLQNFKEFPELRFNIENGLTLCRSCHMKIHNKNKK